MQVLLILGLLGATLVGVLAALLGDLTWWSIAFAAMFVAAAVVASVVTGRRARTE
jgi:uncharacterized ion transporter superfamily protein YfcC